ncbi:AtzH-like domain-containing protein [Agromyces sp. PvR057]|uniref:AtzH-like domain-containing protein n=1 Tax=Agromyces sp. PvR057 TaxID=3156403 RepID=UPI0033996B59
MRGAELPDGLVEAVNGYEAALMRDDLEQMDRYFAPGERTLRADGTGVLVGHEAISRYRRTRGGAARRTVTAMHVRPVGDRHAWVLSESVGILGGTGLVSQLWERDEGVWRIVAAHVSQSPISS